MAAPKRRRLRHCYVIVCVCVMLCRLTSSSPDVTSRDQRPMTSSQQLQLLQGVRATDQQTTKTRPRLGATTFPRCRPNSMQSCLTKSADFFPNAEATFDKAGILRRQQPLNSLSSSRNVKSKDVERSSDEEQSSADDESRVLSTGLSRLSFDRPTFHQLQRVHLLSIFAPIPDQMVRKAALLVSLSSRQLLPLPTDKQFQTTLNSLNAGRPDDDDDDDGFDLVKNAARALQNRGSIRAASLSDFESRNAGRRTQLFTQPLTRMADESVPVPLRVRRSSWYVKQPRYYRHNDDSWTRRNWRVNQMRVWGKRQHQQQQHRRPTTDYSWN